MSLASLTDSLSLEETYNLYDLAVRAVIIGIVIEEIPLAWMAVKFFREWYVRGVSSAFRKALHHWKEIVESIGFIVLVLGLVFESQFQTAARHKEAAEKQVLTENVRKNGDDAAKEGVRATTAEEEMKGRQADTEARLQKLEKDREDARIAQGSNPSSSRPPPSKPVNPPPPPPPPPKAVVKSDEEIERTIRETVRSGAVVSIIPFLPSVEQFANALGAALAKVPGVQVAVGHGNMIMNGQTGLIVQYDHSNPVSASVFNALVKAGLTPIDGGNTPGNSVVIIKVAPPQ